MDSIGRTSPNSIRTDESASSSVTIGTSPCQSPLFTAHLSSKVANGRVFQPQYISRLYETLAAVMEAYNDGRKTEEEAKPIIHEAYAKFIAYGRLTNQIDLPVLENGRYYFYAFTVQELVLTKGNKAFLALPKHANKEISPILLFAGSAPKYRSGTLVANFGPKAIKKTLLSTKICPSFDVGRVIVENNGEWIAGMIKHHAEDGHGKFILAGHSLGGATAAKIAMDGDNHRFIEELVTFNAPGVTKREMEKYDNLDEKFKATNYTTGGDWIGNLFAYSRFIGRKFLITPNDIDITNDRHGACILSSNDYTKTEIMPDKKKSRLYKTIQIVGAITIGLVPRVLLITIALVVLGVHNTGLFDHYKSIRKATRAHSKLQRTRLQALPEWEIQESASAFYYDKRLKLDRINQ